MGILYYGLMYDLPNDEKKEIGNNRWVQLSTFKMAEGLLSEISGLSAYRHVALHVYLRVCVSNKKLWNELYGKSYQKESHEYAMPEISRFESFFIIEDSNLFITCNRHHENAFSFSQWTYSMIEIPEFFLIQCGRITIVKPYGFPKEEPFKLFESESSWVRGSKLFINSCHESYLCTCCVHRSTNSYSTWIRI